MIQFGKIWGRIESFVEGNKVFAFRFLTPTSRHWNQNSI
jgi:hypothetical protein